MKLLRIAENVREFQAEDGQYRTVDKITKEDLLRLVDRTLIEEDVKFDPYYEKSLKNQAHQVIYRSVLQKLLDLRNRRRESQTPAVLVACSASSASTRATWAAR